MSGYDLLVVILGAALAVLLVLTIIGMIWLLQILAQFKRLAKRAEVVMDGAESFSQFVRKSASTAVIAKTITAVANALIKKSRK